jgi:hypothetical protein
MNILDVALYAIQRTLAEEPENSINCVFDDGLKLLTLIQAILGVVF